MFRTLATIAIVAALAVAAYGYYLRKKQPANAQLSWLKGCRVKAVVYSITILSIFTLGITGFWAVIVTGEPATGCLLMLHCTAAAFFCLALPLSLVLSAEKFRFMPDDWSTGFHTPTLRKACFWVLAGAAIPVILSIVLSMLPLFGAMGQEFLYQLHRSSALVLVLAALIFAGLSK